MAVLVSDPRQTQLVEFIKDSMVTEDDTPRPALAMAVQFLSGANPQEISSVRLGSARKWEPKELAAKFWKAIVSHATGIQGGMQTYRVVVLYGEGEHEREFPVSIEGDLGLKRGTVGTEGPTPTGQTMQLQRHTEAMVRLVAQMATDTTAAATSLMNSANESLRQLREQNQKLMEENHDAVNLAKSVILEAARRDQERALELRRFDRSTVEREMVLRMLPGLVNQITGQEIFPQNAEDTAIIETLEAKLTPEQIGKLADIVGGEAMAVIAPRIKKAMDKRLAEEAKKRAHQLPAATGDNGGESK